VSIIGVGVDIESIDRFEASDKTDKLLLRVFTAGESDYCQSQAVPSRHFAARFAAKEATVKALHALLPKLLVTQVEIYKKNDSPSPLIRLINGAELPVGVRLAVSLSHSNSQAIAFVVAEH